MKIGSVVWHSKRVKDENAVLPTYEKPNNYTVRPNYLTVMPANSRGYLAMLRYGEDIDNTWTVIANSLFFEGVFSKGDLMWVDGEKPIDSIEEQYGYGCTANAVVVDVACVNRAIHITLNRNKNQENENKN